MIRWMGLMAAVLFMGCCTPPSPNMRRVDNVVQVFMHEAGWYSVLYRDGDELKLQKLYPPNRATRIVVDVEDGGTMWAEYEPLPNSYDRVSIHIRRATTIDGGGWDHGKFGKGQTSSVAP